jgi:transposase
MAKKKFKLPKKIAGVRIPKMLRKSALLDRMLKSATGREIAAKALVAAAGAAAAVLLKEREEVAEAGAATAKKGARAARVARDVVQSASAAVAEVVTEAARSALPGRKDEDRDIRPTEPSRH